MFHQLTQGNDLYLLPRQFCIHYGIQGKHAEGMNVYDHQNVLALAARKVCKIQYAVRPTRSSSLCVMYVIYENSWYYYHRTRK